MSAFLHTSTVINIIAHALKNNTLQLKETRSNQLLNESAESLASQLYAINVASVNYFYGNDYSTTYTEFSDAEVEVSQMQVYKYMRSWRYQSDSNAECRNSPIYILVDASIEEFDETYTKKNLMQPHGTREYGSCEWG